MSVDFAFLDSGTGGIPYMLFLKRKKPEARCVYLGDTAHFPYGQKSPEQIAQCAAEAVRLIVREWHPKVLVVACNTISVTALAELRAFFPELPIVGTVPAVKLAAKVTANKRIGLLATNATVHNPYCKKLIEDFADDCAVFMRGDRELVSFIEHDLFSADATRQQRRAAVAPSLQFFAQNGCDTIILGCTHFTHLADDIKAAAGGNVNIVDSREGVANQALRVLDSLPSLPCSDDLPPRSEDRNEMPRDCRERLQAPPPDKSFFVTAATQEQATEYRKMCAAFKIPWGGIINIID